VQKKDIRICCPACGYNKASKKWSNTNINSKKSILWCDKCGFGWQYPLPTPEEINNYYQNYTTYNIHGANEKEKAFSRRISRINKLKPDRGKLLDVGSGLGHFLKAALNEGWDVAGIEFQRSAALYCQNQLGIKVYNKPFESLSIEYDSFDIITLWDVWEHVHNPLAILDQCIKLLKPGGYLVIAVPNASGIPARIFRGKWRYVMNTHLNYFTFQYINKLFDRVGLKIERADHSVKVQSLLQGFASCLPLKIDTEHIIRLGRRGSIEKDRPEQRRNNHDNDISNLFLNLIRRMVHTINFIKLPSPTGDMMDIYAKKCVKKESDGLLKFILLVFLGVLFI